MKTFLISYDLGLPERRIDYLILKEYIKTHARWAKPLQSVWLIRTTKNITQIRDEIKARVDLNDKIMIIDVTGSNWATSRISKDVTDWMKINV